MIVVPENKEGGGEGEHGDGSHNHANLVNGNKENLLVDPSEGRWAVTLNEVRVGRGRGVMCLPCAETV